MGPQMHFYACGIDCIFLLYSVVEVNQAHYLKEFNCKKCLFGHEYLTLTPK